MSNIWYFFVWLSRINHRRGFGIQSPTDYRFVRCVVNENWPYYAYEEVGTDDSWLECKLGRLYFRLANWRQPSVVIASKAQEYIQAGCRHARIEPEASKADLIIATKIPDVEALLDKTSEQTVLVVENLRRNKAQWQQLKNHEKTRTVFDLYYCGIILFDSKREKQTYIVNF